VLGSRTSSSGFLGPVSIGDVAMGRCWGLGCCCRGFIGDVVIVVVVVVARPAQ